MAGASVEVRTVYPAELPTAPVAALHSGPGSVTLGLPGRAWITVTGADVVIEAASDAVAGAVLAELGSWIVGQAAAQTGNLVLQGACVARDGRALVLGGRPRSGCSLVALALIGQGWSLVSDGVAVLRLDGGQAWAVPGSCRVALDAGAPGVEGLGAKPLATGGRRVLVDVAGVDAEVPVDDVVLLVPKVNVVAATVLPADPSVSWSRLAVARVPDLSGTAGPLDLPMDLVRITTVGVPRTGASPRSIADAIVDVIDVIDAVRPGPAGAA